MNQDPKMLTSKINYQRDRDLAIANLYKKNLSSRQIAYNLGLDIAEVLEVIELLKIEGIEVEVRNEGLVRRRRIEDHQAAIYAREMRV